MKFELPIAEIEHFELRDIISASGGDTLPDNTDDTSRMDIMFDIICDYNDLRDSDNWDDCL